MSDYILINGTLYHHGIKGQKWGQRNYQNTDGSYTAKGQAENNGHGRYSNVSDKQIAESHRNKMMNFYKYRNRDKYNYYKIASEKDILNDLNNKEHIKKCLIAGAAIVGVSSAIYLAYKYDLINKIKNSNDTSDIYSIQKSTSDDIEFILSDNSVIHRMEGFSDIDITKSDGPSYTAFDKDDVRRYKALLRDWSGTGERFDTKYRALKDLKVPTKNRAEEIFQELYKNNKFKDQLVDDISNCYMYAYKKSGHILDKNTALSMARSKLEDDDFGGMIYSIVGKGSASKQYLNTLKDKGYDAIIDYFDAGDLAEKPLIIIDPSSSLQKIGERKVSVFEQSIEYVKLFNEGKIL